MRNFLIILLVFLNVTLIAFSEEWVEVYSKIYIKIDKSQNDKIFYWSKFLNDGTMKPVNNQKIKYAMNYNIEDCTQNSNGLLAAYEYSTSGKVLSSYVSPFFNHPSLVPFEPVVPQSVGEVIHKYVCGFAN